MKMKKWMALSCAAAMVLSTFPVSADEAVNEDVSGSITVWEHAYSFEEALKAVIEGFKAKYPNVEVDYEIKASDYQQVLATALQSGEGPDLFWTNGTATDIMPGYVNNGMVEDLTDVVDFSIITDDAMKLATIDGKQYSVPWLTMDSRACFYNKDIFAENGWEVPTTLEEFETLLGEAAKAGVTPLLTPGNPHGFQIASLVETFALHYMYDAGYLKNNDYLTGHYTDVAKEYAEAGARLRDWVDKGYIDADSLAMTREDSTGQFYLQKGLFAFVNNNELTDLEKNSAEAGFEIGVMAFPAPEGTPTLLHNFGVDGFMVYSGTKYPEQSARFLKYITSKDVQQKFGNETLSVMANKDCTYDNANQSEFAEIFSSAESYRKNYDYSAGDIGSDTGDLEAEFLSDPSETPEEFGQKIEDAYVKLLEENGK